MTKKIAPPHGKPRVLPCLASVDPRRACIRIAEDNGSQFLIFILYQRCVATTTQPCTAPGTRKRKQIYWNKV